MPCRARSPSGIWNRALNDGSLPIARPVHEDTYGRLFHVGRRIDPSAFVQVSDKVLDGSGRPLRHWLSVPPHVATAREAVAWTFGLAAQEFRPDVET